jgi:hypothetical protein
LLAAVALLLATVLCWQNAAMISRDLAFTAAETEVGFWGQGDYVPDEATEAAVATRLDTLLARVPDHPAYLTLAASYYAWRGYRAERLVQAMDYNSLALESQYAAQQRRPAYRQGWLTMLGYASRAGGADEQSELARQQLARLRTGKPN